jgi:hypothetical protein
MTRKISFVVDGKPATLDADPAMPLLACNGGRP